MIYIVMCNYNKLEEMKKSISSIKEQFNDNVKLLIVDNTSVDGSIDWLKNNKNIDKVILNKYNKGKAKAINNLIKETDKEIGIDNDDLIFNLDSDISIISDNFFEKVEDIWRIVSEKVSCLVCIQDGNNLFKRNFHFNHSSIGNFDYFIPSEGFGIGIAGGAMITSYKNWKSVSGYREDRGLYGFNDGGLLLDLYQKTQKPICVIKNLKVFHPFETNEEYKRWKEMAQNQQINFNKCTEEKGFFD